MDRCKRINTLTLPLCEIASHDINMKNLSVCFRVTNREIQFIVYYTLLLEYIYISKYDSLHV